MRAHTFVRGEYTITATDSGTAGQRTFLLVHGIGMGIPYFSALAGELEQHGRVVAVDLPGFGNSPEPRHALTMAQTGALLIDFVEAEGLGRPILIGHSMGTQVVAEAAAQRPDLFPELVLVAPTLNRLERSMGREAWRMLQDLFGESPKVIGVGLKNYARTGPRWFIKKLNAMMAHTVEDTLPLIQAHTLVVRGGRDRVCPGGWVAEVAALIPNAVMVEIAGCGHETMVKDPAPVAREIMRHVNRV